MKNFPLIVGIALPIVFIAIIVSVLYVPGLFINPQYDFIYTLRDNNYYYGNYRNDYEVRGGTLAAVPQPIRENVEFAADIPDLYLYDIETNTSRYIERADAERFSLDPGPSSPDGYQVQYRYSNSGIFELFGGGGNNGGYYIEGEDGAKRLPGIGSVNSWLGNFTFIGWVTK